MCLLTSAGWHIVRARKKIVLVHRWYVFRANVVHKTKGHQRITLGWWMNSIKMLQVAIGGAFNNPWHMREGYGSRSVCECVCLSVCYGYIPHLYVENKVPLGFLWCFQDMHCVAFVENALFKSSGNIC